MNKKMKSSILKQILGVLLMLCGVFMMLYIGVWVFLIGGVVDLVDEVVSISNGSGVNALAVALGVVKIMFAGLAGYISGLLFFIPGVNILLK